MKSVKNIGASGRNVELNRVPECRSVTEQWWTWPQLMCCALTLKNLCPLISGWGEKKRVVEQRWGGSKCGAKGIKMWSKGDQNVEQSGSKCRSKCGARWSKGYCFYLIPNWSLALRQAHLNTGLWRYWKKDYTNKMKSWKDRTIN